jgi:RNA polymerase sigma-70 factor (ECF subfamily)
MEDGELWTKATAGDADAFGILFDRHANAIYNYCFRRVGDWALAEDLTSVVFLEAWRRRRTPIEQGKLLPWLFGVATNVIRNARRSLRRYEAALGRLPLPGPEPDFAPETAEELGLDQQLSEAMRLLALLPAREREIFVLCAWQGLSYQDAALALGIPLGTVRSRLSRARENLRELRASTGHIESRTAALPTSESIR